MSGHSQMKDYDKLPLPLRETVANSPVQWDTERLLDKREEALGRGFTLSQATQRLKRMLEQWNQEELSKCSTTSTTS